MKNFSQLKKNLKGDFSTFKTIKVALLGDASTQLLSIALRGMGYEYRIDLDVFEADFNQIEKQVFDYESDLYKFTPEFIIICLSSHKLLQNYNRLEPPEYGAFADSTFKFVRELCSAINAQLVTKIIFYNYPELNDSVFGNYANKVESSFIFQQRKLNYRLMVFAVDMPNFFICDISSIQNQHGKSQFFHPAIYVHSAMVLSLDILPEVALKTLDIISALEGNFKKCLIVDLDNTLWGGIIGDDGIENIQIGTLGIGKAFSELQYWIKKLKNRGIIIAVCSKNTESVAKEVFEQHPDMILKLEDIAVFVANWDNKPDNIRKIQSILKISFDSIVFLDDNPFERNIVKENIPEITVPEMPEDPAEYLEYLYTLNLFETASFSLQDKQRTKQYQIEVTRDLEKQFFTNEDDFLKSLDMQSTVEPINKFNEPRVIQLSQRSNQFNLTTVRYTGADIQKITVSPDYLSFCFTLNDKFDELGLVAVVIMKKENSSIACIENWFMSCRVLKRGMEHFILNTIAGFAKEYGLKLLKGQYIATNKNEMVRDHYLNLGFIQKNAFWELDLNSYEARQKVYILKK